MSQWERAKALQWLEEWHDRIDKLDAEGQVPLMFTKDAALQYANQPVVMGRSNIQATFKSFFEQIDLLKHDISYFDIINTRIYAACSIHYVVRGDDPATQTISIKAFSTFDRVEEDGILKVDASEIYIDPSALYNRIKDKFGAVEYLGAAPQ